MNCLFLFRIGFPNNIALKILFISELVATNHAFVQLDSFTHTVFLCYRRVAVGTLFLFIGMSILGILKCTQSYCESDKSASVSLQNDLLSIFKSKFCISKIWNGHITCVYRGCDHVAACNLTYRSSFSWNFQCTCGYNKVCYCSVWSYYLIKSILCERCNPILATFGWC